MAQRDSVERRFSEDMERLARGQEPPARDADYATMLDFARRLMDLGEEPSASFTSRLREDLMREMAQRDAAAEARPSLLLRLFGGHAVRLAVVSAFVVLAAIGLVWRAGLLSPLLTPSGDAGPALTQEAPPEAPQEEEAEEEEAAMPEMVRAADEAEDAVGAAAPSPSTLPMVVRAEAVPTVVRGETVTMSVFFENPGPEGMTVAPYPPAIHVRALNTGTVVYSFEAGASSLALSPMESARYDVTWEQLDQGGQPVPAGMYAVDVVGSVAMLEPDKAESVSLEVMGVAIIEIVPG